jgi:uncharacterized metal-binding protein
MSTATNEPCCSRNEAPTLIFACSGAADVGLIADLAARRLSSAGFGKMLCLAGIGGRVHGILKTTETARRILAIDGCTLDCAQHTLSEAGIRDFAHLRLTDLDLEKGKSPATDERIDQVVRQGRTMLAECR